MPSDFATNEVTHRGVNNRDVAHDLHEDAHLGPLEIIWTPDLGAPLPWRPKKVPPNHPLPNRRAST